MASKNAGGGGTVGPREVANPGYQQDEDAAPNSTLTNPLMPGKKQVEVPQTSEWGTLRYGVPKDGTNFGLPAQKNPDPDQNLGGGGNVSASQDNPSFYKGSAGGMNQVM